MADRRQRNITWATTDPDGKLYMGVNQGVFVALLMDIRDELQRLNALLHCENFTQIPKTLNRIVVNTTKKKRAKKQGKP